MDSSIELSDEPTEKQQEAPREAKQFVFRDKDRQHSESVFGPGFFRKH
jgi:hypothetical protein